MLVLSRKVGEKIRIGKDIVVVFKAIQGGRVKIGIDAPQLVRVVRSELLGDSRVDGKAASTERERKRLISPRHDRYAGPARESLEA